MWAKWETPAAGWKLAVSPSMCQLGTDVSQASGCCGPWGVFQPSHPWLAVAVGSIPCALRGLFVRSGGTGLWRGRVGVISEQKACPLSPGECLTRALLLESAWALFWQPRDSEEMHERVSGALLCWRSGCAASEHGCEEKSLRALTSGGGGGAGRREGVAVTQWCARCSVFIPCLVCRGVGWPTWSAVSPATSHVVVMSGWLLRWPVTGGRLGHAGGASGRSLELFSPADPCPCLVPAEGELSYESVLALGHILLEAGACPAPQAQHITAQQHPACGGSSGLSQHYSGRSGWGTRCTLGSTAACPAAHCLHPASLTRTPGTSHRFPAPQGLSQPFP